MRPRHERPTCQLHGHDLEPGHARIVYGLPGPGWFGDRREAAQRLFPHANSCVLGGCLVHDLSPRLDEVLFCPACRDAEAGWESERRDAARRGRRDRARRRGTGAPDDDTGGAPRGQV